MISIAIIIFLACANAALAYLCIELYRRKSLYKKVCRNVCKKYSGMLEYEKRLASLSRKLKDSYDALSGHYDALGDSVSEIGDICREENGVAEEAMQQIDGDLEIGAVLHRQRQ